MASSNGGKAPSTKLNSFIRTFLANFRKQRIIVTLAVREQGVRNLKEGHLVYNDLEITELEYAKAN